MTSAEIVWSAPVRYMEVEQQGIVFDAHYLTYCDEAIAAYPRCARTGRTSATFEFVVTASGRPGCTVPTVYVDADEPGVPQPVPDAARRRLTAVDQVVGTDVRFPAG